MRLQVLPVRTPDEPSSWLLILDDVGNLPASNLEQLAERLTASAKTFGGAGALVFSMKVEVQSCTCH